MPDWDSGSIFKQNPGAPMEFNVTEIRKRLTKVTVLYTDVDGTFVNDGCLFRNRRGYSLRNAEAIYRLLEADVDVVMTSGREKEKLKETARLLGFRNYIANLGMQIVYNLGEKVILNYGGNFKSPAEIKNWIQSTGVAEALLQQFSGKIDFYHPWSDILQTHLLFIGELPYREVTRWMATHYPSLRIIDNGEVPPYGKFSQPHTYHVLPHQIGKRSAVKIDKQERSLPREQLVGIGDSLEDVSIAPEVGVFFLLDPSVPSQEDNVIYLPNEDGEAFSRIVHFLKENQLI